MTPCLRSNHSFTVYAVEKFISSPIRTEHQCPREDIVVFKLRLGKAYYNMPRSLITLSSSMSSTQCHCFYDLESRRNHSIDHDCTSVVKKSYNTASIVLISVLVHTSENLVSSANTGSNFVVLCFSIAILIKLRLRCDVREVIV